VSLKHCSHPHWKNFFHQLQMDIQSIYAHLFVLVCKNDQEYLGVYWLLPQIEIMKIDPTPK
jgi:hypothetical protein